MQIVWLLKQAEHRYTVGYICREYGFRSACYYQWKFKYGGLEASDLKCLKEIQAENSRLRKMYAEMAMENQALKVLLEKL